MSKYNGARVDVPIDRIVVDGATEPRINGEYSPKSAEEIPSGFTRVCQGQGWDPEDTWRQLNGGATWYGMPNGAYIYWNTSDGMWWIDEPNGKGVWKAEAPKHAPPQLGWVPLGNRGLPPTLVASVRKVPAAVEHK